MPGLAFDPERSASGACARGVHRPLQRLASPSQPGLGAAEWSPVNCEVDGNATDNAETSRSSRRTLARVRACGVSQLNKCTVQVGWLRPSAVTARAEHSGIHRPFGSAVVATNRRTSVSVSTSASCNCLEFVLGEEFANGGRAARTHQLDPFDVSERRSEERDRHEAVYALRS